MACVDRGGASVVGLLVFALGTGCALDEYADGAGDTDGQEGAADGETSSPDDASEGSTGGATPDPTGLTGGDATSGGESGGADSGGPLGGCDELSCSGGGFCEIGDAGPECVCDEGWASVGLDCIPCENVVDTMLPATVPTVRTAFTFRLDGVEPPEDAYAYGRISLRNRTSGDVVVLGDTFDSGASVMMVPGVYDVIYSHRQGSAMPKNEGAVLEQVEIEADDSVTIDIESSTLRGSITFDDGDEPQSPAYDYGKLFLVDTTTGDEVPLGNTHDGTYEVRVIPGAYEIHYELRQFEDASPLNRDGVLGTVNVGPGSNVEDIFIRVARIEGRITVDGAQVLDAYDNGDLELRDVETGDRFPLGQTELGSFSAPVLPGAYEVLYTSKVVGEATPLNQDAVVGTIQVDGADLTYDVQLQTALVSGDFSLNDAVIPTTNFDDGIVTLEGPSTGTVRLGTTSEGSYAARVLVGSYDVFYGQDTAGTSMPVNTHARLRMLDVQADSTHDLDIPAIEVVGNLTIGGVAAPDSPYDDGRLYLRNAESGDKALLGNTREGTYAARVVPGTYDVVYENEFSDQFLPVNRGAVLLEGIEIVQGAAPLDIDVPVATLVGAVEIQGSTPSPDEGVGNLFLRDVTSGDEVFIGHTGSAEFIKPLTRGTYIMEYRGVAAAGASLGASLPANEKAAFACFEVLAGSQD